MNKLRKCFLATAFSLVAMFSVLLFSPIVQPAEAVADLDSVEQALNCIAQANDEFGGGRADSGRRLYNSCYTADAIMELYTPGVDIPMSVQSPSAISDVVEQVFPREIFAQTLHLNGNLIIEEKSEDRAKTRSNVIGVNWKNDGTLRLGSATYIDELSKNGDRWQVAKRQIYITGLGDIEATIPAAH